MDRWIAALLYAFFMVFLLCQHSYTPNCEFYLFFFMTDHTYNLWLRCHSYSWTVKTDCRNFI